MAELELNQNIPEYQEPDGPIIINLKRKKKKRKRYSKGLEEFQQMERHFTRASHRMARAIEKGIGDYRLSSIKSSKKRRDGVIRDFIPNSGIALTHALKEIGAVPNDVARALNTKPMRRRLRRQLRGIRRVLRT